MLVRRCFRGIPEKCHGGQAGAAIEGPILDGGGALTDRDAGQTGAFIKGVFLDADVAVRNCDARQAGAINEGIIRDAGDRLAFNCRRNG